MCGVQCTYHRHAATVPSSDVCSPVFRSNFEEVTDLLSCIIDRNNPVVDPVPFDLIRLRNLLRETRSGRPDELSELIARGRTKDELATGALRSGIVQMKSQISRLQNAIAVIEAELQKRQ
ncbi:MAG: hypothetical protein R3C19_27360 [Planctomycetaceae bacterium]